MPALRGHVIVGWRFWVSETILDSRRAALERAVRVGDQCCTGYAHLRDKYRRYSFWLDLSILLLSGWLVSMVFVQPHIAVALSPKQVPSEIWIGLLSIFAFSLSLIQLLVNWKGRAQLYQQAVLSLSAFVKEYRPLLSTISVQQAEAALARYGALTDGLEPIPESQFLRLKKKHRLKVELSKLLDTHPGANLFLWRIRIVLRDNVLSRKAKTAPGEGNH